MKEKLIKYKYILILLIIAAIPRFLLLGRIPPGLNFDEIDYVINAKTVYVAGTDLSATWKPWSLTTIPYGDPKGELTAVLLAPFIGPFPFSLWIAKLPFTLAGIASVVLVYAIAKKLFDNQEIAFLAGLVTAVNPLTIFSSRIGYDIPLTAIFFLAAFFVMLYASKWRLLWAMPLLFFAFFGYAGMKLIFLPFVIITSLYSWKVIKKKKYSLQYSLLILFSLMLLGLFLVRLPELDSSRRSEALLNPNHPIITGQVNNFRRLSLSDGKLLNNIFVNKYIDFSKTIINRFLTAFSTPLLFYGGDNYHFFFLWNHGVFYYADAVFLLTGSYFLAKKHKGVGLLILLLLPISTLPSLLSGPELSYVYRSYLFFIWLHLVIAAGLYKTINFNKKYRKTLIASLALIYSLQFVNFANEFYLRNPVYHQDQSQFPFRVFSRYLVEEKQKADSIVVLGSDPRQIFQQYILFSGLIDQLSDKMIREQIAERFRTSNLNWENMIFTSDCERPKLSKEETLVLRDDIACDNLRERLPDKYIAVSRISDSGHEYRIYNAETCQNNELLTYIRSVSLKDLQVEKLTKDYFCEKFIVRN